MNANLMTKKIEMTKTEAKAAGKIGTPEYNNLMQLMQNFSGFQIEIVKISTKRVDRFKGLDYDYMKSYIENHKVDLLETFYELRGLNKEGKQDTLAAAASYGEIKMWFLTQFHEIEAKADKVNEIIEKAREARELRKIA